MTDTDRYGRTVGEVILPDGRSLNNLLVEDGFAWWYRRYAPNDRALDSLEGLARAEKRGLWADKEPVAPWEWRKGKRSVISGENTMRNFMVVPGGTP